MDHSQPGLETCPGCWSSKGFDGTEEVSSAAFEASSKLGKEGPLVKMYSTVNAPSSANTVLAHRKLLIKRVEIESRSWNSAS
jgi:hypothetical protein